MPILVPASVDTLSADFFTPDLAKIVDVWPGLQPAIKTVILAMIDAAKSAQEGDLREPKLSVMQSDAN